LIGSASLEDEQLEPEVMMVWLEDDFPKFQGVYFQGKQPLIFWGVFGSTWIYLDEYIFSRCYSVGTFYLLLGGLFQLGWFSGE